MADKIDLIHKDLTEKIIGAAIEVHKILGSGYIESIYEEALIKEFQLRYIKYERQKEVEIFYKDGLIGNHRLDLFVEDEIIVELKAVKVLTDIHQAQLLSYLKATNKKVGLLLNFSKPVLDIKRMVL